MMSTTSIEIPFITVVVPVRNEGNFIEGTIRHLMDQEYVPTRFEVIVVDGRSTDATWSIVEGLQGSYSNLFLRDNPKRLSSAARNIGVRHARGDLIVVVDGHCELGDRD